MLVQSRLSTLYYLLFFTFHLLFIPFFSPLFAQSHIDWQNLADVTFEEKEDEANGMIYNQATFGPIISQFQDQEVIISGYMIPMDAMGLSYALSLNPNAACFFCGSAGPETVLQLKLSKIKRYRTDERLTFKGRLQLNEQDINSLTYVLLDAKEL